MRRSAWLRLDHRPLVLELLNKMATYNRILRDGHRTMAYHNAATAIEAHASTGPLLSADQLKGVPKVGAGTLRRIEEIIRTGNLAEAEALQKDPRMSELIHVHGFGPVAALKFADLGVFTLADLRRQADTLELTAAQRIGIDYHDAISERIPCAEVAAHDQLLQQAVDAFSAGRMKIVVCGSYRRKLPTSGDVDVLLTPRLPAAETAANGLTLGAFVDHLQGQAAYVIERLGVGDTKFMGIARLPGKTPRRVDIRYVSLAQFPTALLYFTGSKGFNIDMRSIALERGYMLNEYGLYKLGVAPSSTRQDKAAAKKGHKKGKPSKSEGEKAPAKGLASVAVASEEEIFETIGMKFVQPQDRK